MPTVLPHPVRRAALLALLLALTSLAWACSSSPARRPTAKPTAAEQAPATPDGRLDLTAEGGLKLTGEGLKTGGLYHVRDAGPWPDPDASGKRHAPISAVVTVDAQGAAWLIHDRAGSTLQSAEVFAAVPKGSAYPRRAAVGGEAFVMDLTTQTPMALKAGDRAVLVDATASGPISSRVVGMAYAKGDKWRVQKKVAGKKPLLVVRVDSVDDTKRATKLAVNLEAGDCNQAQLDPWRSGLSQTTGIDELDRLNLDAQSDVRVSAVMIDCKGANPRLELQAPAGGRLLNTPFWSPEKIKVSNPDVARAVLAAYRGDRALAMALLADAPEGDPFVQAALALELGWSTDVPALLSASNNTLEAKLIRAGAAYELGALEAADKELQSVGEDTGSVDGRTEALRARVFMAKAAVALSRKEPGKAVEVLRAGLEATKETLHEWTLELSMAEVSIARGDFEMFKKSVARVVAQKDLTVMQRGTALRYQAMISRLEGDVASSMNTYQQAAEVFGEAGNHRQAALMWRFVVEVAMENDPSRVEQAMTRAEGAAAKSFDRSTTSTIASERFVLFCIQHVQDENPPVELARTLEEAAADAALRAGRYGELAKVRRYGLLVMAPNADIDAKARQVESALDAALATNGMEEIVMLMSLMAQLEGARFRFKQAEALLNQALAFAQTSGDAELEAMIKAELEAMSER